MKASPIQPSFSGGEFSPKVFGRVDNERYRTALASSLNFLPMTQGPIIRRPGTKYVGNDVKDPSKPPTLIPFQFSQRQNYMLEFGDQYVRFYTNGGQIVTSTNIFKTSGLVGLNGAYPTLLTFNALQTDSFSRPGLAVSATSAIASGGVLELTTPFDYTQASGLKYCQHGDTMYLSCSSTPIYKLQRLGNYDWLIQPLITKDGPYLPFNSYSTTGDSVDVTLTPSNVGLPTITTGPQYFVYGTADNGAGRIRLTLNTSHIFVDGDRVAVRSVPGSLEANNGTSRVGAEYWTVAVPAQNQLDLNGSLYGFVCTGSTGVVSPALFELYDPTSTGQVPPIWADAAANRLRNFSLVQSGKRYWGLITGVQNAATATGILYQSLPNTSVIATWQLGPWNIKNGYPQATCLHQDRLVLAGSKNYPQRFDLSVTSDYENFAPANSSLVVADDNAISFSTVSNQLNLINWVKSDTHGLLAGTLASEWSIIPTNQNGALTPTNVNAKEMSFFGSANADAVQTGNATLYVQNGQRRIRELNWFYQVDTYRSTDIAELSDHLALPGLDRLVNQREPIPLVWSKTTDGKLRSMTYSRDDQTLKVGWAPHQLGGQSDSSGTAPVVKSIAAMPSADGTFDQLWCVVKRYINGTSVCNIEYTTKIFDDQTDPQDAICLDLSGTYDSPITIAGITQAGSAIVSAANHGLVDGDQVKITEVVGLNSSFVSVNGVVFNSNLVNGRIFRAGSTSTNAFFLQDINNGSSYVDSRSYTTYFSGGEVRKMVKTISGFTWLKNETVNILADGKDHPATQVNSAGVLALQYRAAVVQVGYGYNSDGKTLRPEVGSAEASSIGDLRRPYQSAFMLHRTGEMSIGPSFDKLTPLNLNQDNPQQADTAAPLFSGIIRESLETAHDLDGQVCFRMKSALPGMVQAIVKKLEVNDV